MRTATEGRANNRRAEFHIVAGAEKETAADKAAEKAAHDNAYDKASADKAAAKKPAKPAKKK